MACTVRLARKSASQCGIYMAGGEKKTEKD
jgi:hypothetical protein